jgi:hypothetical protein
MSIKKRIFLFCAFACVGITGEIFWTAFGDLFDMFQQGNLNWKLQGKSYIWMFPIYGLAGIFFPLIVPLISKLPWILRVSIYATGILIVEFITGGLLDLFTGQCPWEYKTGWHIMGYIRLDYFPAWALFGYLLETLVKFFDKFDI